MRLHLGIVSAHIYENSDSKIGTFPTDRTIHNDIAALPLQPFQFGQYEGKRRVASFGYSYNYTLRRLSEAEPIPEWLIEVARKVEAFGGPGTEIQQVLCTEYDIGVGIGWHRDKLHFDQIFGLSLGSVCKLRFRRQAYTKWERRPGRIREAIRRSGWEEDLGAGQTLPAK
jgi:hypothetical protein